MKILKEQTLYQCSYCGKRLLTKQGCALHENNYCNNLESPNAKRIDNFKKNCQHKNRGTAYRYIPGEAVQEPDYDYCVECGKRF